MAKRLNVKIGTAGMMGVSRAVSGVGSTGKRRARSASKALKSGGKVMLEI